MATMDDIAKRVGVSKGTVSKALSGAEGISEAMRRTILETAVEMGYSRILRSNVSPKICAFIENMDFERPGDFGYDLVQGFRIMAEPAGFSVDLVPLTAALQMEMPYDEYMLKHDYKGGFFMGINYNGPWFLNFENCHTPTVLFDNKHSYNPMVTCVMIDTDEAMNLIVQRLRALGHTRIGYLSGCLNSYVFQERYQSFFLALDKNGLWHDSSLAGQHDFTNACIEEHLPRLLEIGCTAIICSHDLLAYFTMIRCKELGFSVPEQISIVGIDDLPLCENTMPTLSSIRQNRTELGRSAFYALSCQINQIHINQLLLHPQLIIRESVGQASM